MKYLMLAALLLSACSTATANRWWRTDWEFDCEWAQFYDFQVNARNRAMGMPFKSKIATLYCEMDPTDFDSPLYGRKTENKK
jgi:hypothetical protein